MLAQKCMLHTGLCGTEASRRRPRRMHQRHPHKQAFYFNFKIARSFWVVFCHSGSFRACPGFLRVFFRMIPGTCGKPGGFRRKCPGLRETRRKLRVCPGLGFRFRDRENSGFYAHKTTQPRIAVNKTMTNHVGQR
jgi:hypothetical protein